MLGTELFDSPNGDLSQAMGKWSDVVDGDPRRSKEVRIREIAGEALRTRIHRSPSTSRSGAFAYTRRALQPNMY